MKIISLISIFIICAITLLSSCDRDPIFPPEPVIEHISIAQLKAMYESGIVTVDTNVYIQGIITLTPEFGNIPDFVGYIQDSTAGLCITVASTNTLSRDSKVTIFCRGLSFTMYNGLLQFGDIDMTNKTQFRIDSLTPVPLEPVNVTLGELLEGKHQAEFVAVTGVQFKTTGTFSGTKILTDCDSEVDVYTRSVSTFAGQTMPSGNGTFVGVASVFNTTQLILRDPIELNMTGNPCGIPSLIYLTQDFSSLAKYADVSALTGWKTYAEAGTKTWYCNEVSGKGKWVQVYIFNSGQPSVISWMITPQINLETGNKPYIKFESSDGFDNGATLQLFVSSDYTGSATPWANNWNELTFIHPPSTNPQYSAFVSSGKVDLSDYIGKIIYIAWVVKGGDLPGDTMDKTTTWEVDNVLVAEE